MQPHDFGRKPENNKLRNLQTTKTSWMIITGGKNET